MKKQLFILVVLAGAFLTCNKSATQILGANAIISTVNLSVGLTGSDTLTITGTGFTNAANLSGSFDGIPFNVLTASTTQLVAVVDIPLTSSTVGTIIINGAGVPLDFQYGLSIDSFRVAQTAGGGTNLTIYGQGFVAGLSGLSVTFAGQTFTITGSTSTEIDATNAAIAPIRLVGGKISIGGIASQTIAKPFTLAIASVSPLTGQAGTSVTISGLGFSSTLNVNKVTFNGIAATVTAATSTSLTATAPALATTGPVAVTVGTNTIVGPNFSFPAIQSPVSTFAGSGISGSANGVGTAATFNSPENGVFDHQGNLYVADYGNNMIRKVTPDGTVTTFAGSTSAGFKDGQGTSAQFTNPSGLVFDPQGNLYVCDELNYRIRKIDPNGNVTTLAGSGVAGLQDASSGLGAKFNRPVGIGIDTIGGNLYVADSRNNMIRVINIATGSVSTVLGQVSPGYGDGDSTIASFNSPRGLAVYSTGAPGNEIVHIFVADYGNNKIREIYIVGAAKKAFTIAGDPGNNAGMNITPPTFRSPNAVAIGVAKDGVTPELFIADASNHVIRVINPFDPTSVAPVGTALVLAGTGTAGITNGSYTSAHFFYPDGVVFNPLDGNLYVVEFGGNDIRKIILQ